MAEFEKNEITMSKNCKIEKLVMKLVQDPKVAAQALGRRNRLCTNQFGFGR